MVFAINKTIKHYFSDFYDRLNSVEDNRKRAEYSIGELVMGGIVLFLFKEKSRNSFNQNRKDAQFCQNYQCLFKCKLPHLDAVDDIFRVLNEDELEKLKAEFVSALIRMKVFHKFKFLGKRFKIVVDATNTVTYDNKHCEHCLTRTYKDTKVYFHYILEAKLVTSNGLCISIASEWIDNEHKTIVKDFEKQDCEQKAFKRLSAKLKQYFPRLPICIIADGLYPNKTIFNICKSNNWNFIFTFKDGNLPSVWEEINLLPESKQIKLETFHSDKNENKICKYKWLNNIEYDKFKINYIELEQTIIKKENKTEEIKRFVYITDLEINRKNSIAIVAAGRERWKIENEGFNIQKNNDYELEHKYSRASYTAMKNFYQCLQIAHTINQLCEKSIEIQTLKQENRFTIKYLWKRIISFMLEGFLTENDAISLDIGRIQIRLAK